jgi:hypothetical protein
MDNYLVKSQIVSVEEHFRTKNNRYTWREAGISRFLYIFVIDRWNSGYASEFFRDYESKEEWEADNYIEYEPKGGLYLKPHLVMVTSDGTRHVKFFDTPAEVVKWRIDKLFNVNLIQMT